jgi:hypothetical protein
LVAATTTTTCRGCGAPVTLTARFCFVCKAPDPTIGRAHAANTERAGRRLFPFWLAAFIVLALGAVFLALASLMRGN